MLGFFDALFKTDAGLLPPLTKPITSMPALDLPISDARIQEIADRLREDDRMRSAARERALSGEWVGWLTSAPLDRDYPVEVARNGGEASMLTERPPPWWNVSGICWRKTV